MRNQYVLEHDPCQPILMTGGLVMCECLYGNKSVMEMAQSQQRVLDVLREIDDNLLISPDGAVKLKYIHERLRIALQGDTNR